MTEPPERDAIVTSSNTFNGAVMLDFKDYMIVLLARSENAVDGDSDRFVGMGFCLEDGRLATCAHVVELVLPGEKLYAADMKTRTCSIVQDIKQHAKYDFATGTFETIRDFNFFKLEAKKFRIGHDVHTYGCTDYGKVEGKSRLDARFFKGYVVRTFDDPIIPRTRSTLEISFPAHKGFSGSPLFCPNTGFLIGMIVSNSQSSIDLHTISEIDDAGNKYRETTNRIVELGLAHSNLDMIEFLREIN